MAKKIESFMYPEKIYLAEIDGRYEFFKEDPLNAEDRDAARIDLGACINAFLGGGRCTIGNPIILKIRGGRMDRCRPFSATAPQNIRRGTLAAHFEDYDGNYVEILPGNSGFFEFPFIGAVLRKDGTPVGFRNYSTHGQCMDESPDHELFLIDGALALEMPDGKEPVEAPVEEPAAEGAEEPAEEPVKASRVRKPKVDALASFRRRKKEESAQPVIFDDKSFESPGDDAEEI